MCRCSTIAYTNFPQMDRVINRSMQRGKQVFGFWQQNKGTDEKNIFEVSLLIDGVKNQGLINKRLSKFSI